MNDLSKTMAEFPSAQQKPKGAGRWKPILLAMAIPLGLAVVLWFVFRDQLTPAVPVKTGRVILLEQEASSSAAAQAGPSELLFQASGWVEPDPWPINLAVKVDGFVEEVFIKEGESVTNGQIVATLDPTDAHLALEAAEGTVQAAQKHLASASARRTMRHDTWKRYSNTPPSAISDSDRIEAEQEFLEAEADEQAARAALRVAMAGRDATKLALDRTVIRSSMDGMVLRRLVKPGDKRRIGADDPDSAIIASLYNPTQLQVRVDVPISEAGKMIVGQPTKITTGLLAGQTFNGRVTRIIGQADLQRNTLQAKVQINDPDPRLRPEVLCRVEFWNPASSRTAGESPSGSHALWIPIEALASEAAEQPVWVVEPLTRTVKKRTIQLMPAVRDGMRRVADGLRANESVVLEAEKALKDGARVKEAGQ